MDNMFRLPTDHFPEDNIISVTIESLATSEQTVNFNPDHSQSNDVNCNQIIRDQFIIVHLNKEEQKIIINLC